MPQQPTELNITDLVPDATAGDVTAMGGTMDLVTFTTGSPCGWTGCTGPVHFC
jgi:hypothetical protein